jgi:hypothetical protein
MRRDVGGSGAVQDGLDVGGDGAEGEAESEEGDALLEMEAISAVARYVAAEQRERTLLGKYCATKPGNELTRR